MCNGGTKADCPRPTLNAGAIEKLVWDSVTEFISRPEQVQALLEARQRDLESGATLENVVKGRDRLSQVDAERGRALLQHQRGSINDKVGRSDEGYQRAVGIFPERARETGN